MLRRLLRFRHPRSATVEFFTDAAGDHRFRLVAANGEVVPDGYTSRADAHRGWETFLRLAQDARVVERP